MGAVSLLMLDRPDRAPTRPFGPTNAGAVTGSLLSLSVQAATNAHDCRTLFDRDRVVLARAHRELAQPAGRAELPQRRKPATAIRRSSGQRRHRHQARDWHRARSISSSRRSGGTPALPGSRATLTSIRIARPGRPDRGGGPARPARTRLRPNGSGGRGGRSGATAGSVGTPMKSHRKSSPQASTFASGLGHGSRRPARCRPRRARVARSRHVLGRGEDLDRPCVAPRPLRGRRDLALHTRSQIPADPLRAQPADQPNHAIPAWRPARAPSRRCENSSGSQIVQRSTCSTQTTPARVSRSPRSPLGRSGVPRGARPGTARGPPHRPRNSTLPRPVR